MRATRRTVRSAAIATGVIAATLALPVGIASADSPTAPDTHQDQGETVRESVGQKSGGEKPDTSKRTYVRTYKNLGGSGFDAKVFKTKSGYEAEMWGKDTASNKVILWDTLTQSGIKAAYGQHNGAHFVLNPDGTMKGWVEGGGKKQDNKKQNKKTQSKKTQSKTHDKAGNKTPQGHVVPKGGVKAGAEGVEKAPDTAMVAAGGGMAAAGAAGLGFAMLRRRRTDGEG
ncbi:hypothetical protein U9R90_16720 [Streptomyces sp. E11-3]|uniref:hypothetical protein n=1 Tax=Streptomyces sp. E11-3 TaxID=3110112 RepID=UPI003981413C